MKKINRFLKIRALYEGQKSVVYCVINRFKADKTLKAKPRTDKHPMTTKLQDQMIIKKSFQDPFYTATSISRAFVSKQDIQS